MDIDEFLDRELSDIGFGTDKAEKPEAAMPEFQQDYESSPLFENIKSSLGKGNLDEAEQAYVELWHLLGQQKLKWNKELYGQLLSLSRQFAGALNSAYNEIKKKAEHANELIGRARASLKEGKKELPFKLYSEMQEISNSIPAVFFEEKKMVQEQIMGFYEELRSATDDDLLKRVAGLIREINALMDKINNALRSGDMINAIVSYNKCIEMYNQIPEGFLKYKNTAGMRLLDIYKSLSIYTEISDLQKQLASGPLADASSRMPEMKMPTHAPARRQLVQGFEPAFSKPGIPAPDALKSKKERAKMNIQKGLYSEAYRDIQEALQLEPNDAEARAMHAKIKTLQ